MDMTALVSELKMVLAVASDEAPYCVLSLRQVLAVVAVLEAAPGMPVAGDPWLAKVEAVLTPIEYRIYRELYRAQGQVVAANAVFKESRARTVTSLWVHMRRLRDKCMRYDLGEIQTVRQKGYRVVLPGWAKEA